MPDLIKKRNKERPYLAALEERIIARDHAAEREYEQQANRYSAGQEQAASSVGPNTLTPAAQAEFMRRSGANPAPTAYQQYMMGVVNSTPRQEETRSTDELRRDMNRQNMLATGMNRMAADASQGIQNRLYDQGYTDRLRVIGDLRDQQETRAAEATERYMTVSAQRWAEQERERYGALLKNPDFVEKGKGDARIADKGPASSYTEAETLYKNIYHRNDGYKDGDALSVSPAQYVTDEEASTFFYLWNTQGARAAKAYYDDYVENRASARKAEAVQRQAAAYGAYDPVGASIASVGTNLVSGVGLVDIAFQNLARAVGLEDRDKPINYNSGAMMPGLVTDSLRSGVSDYLEKLYPNAKIGNTVNVASFLYETGMSMADSGVAILLNSVGIPEPLTLANMGAAAGTRAIRDAKERGASDGQALAFGISSALMEALFEKISLDSILAPSNATRLRQHVWNAVKQSFTEGSEEVMTTVANTVMDQLIMGDKSELFRRQQALMEQGVSAKEALGAAWKQWGTGVLGDLLGGMVSGFGMGGGKEAGTGVRSAARDFRLARELTDIQLARPGGSLTRNHANDTVNPTAAAGGARSFPDGSFQQRAREAAGENGVLESRERAAGLGRLLADIRNTRTIRDARRRQAEAASIRNRAEARGLAAENLREIGVTGVADDVAAPILADDVLGRDWVRTVEEYARKGVALRAMLGSIERQGRSGGRERIRAWVSGDGKTILVQADHPDLDWKQLLAHEELHRLIKEDGAYRKAVEERLLGDEKLRPYLFAITDRYMQRYLETEPGMTEEDVIEELLADYRAGFDMLDPLGLSEPAAAKLAKRAAKDIRALERKGINKEQNGGRREGEAASNVEIGRYSKELHGEYWRPSLSKAEWNIANRAIESYAGEDFNGTKRYALKTEKGETVFVIYSKSDDATMLYAIGGKDAVDANDFVNLWKEGNDDGLNEIANTLGVDLEELGHSGGNRASDYALPQNGGGAGGVGTVSLGESGPKTKRKRNHRQSKRDSEFRALINALQDGNTPWISSKTSTEIDTDYLSDVNSVNMETAQRQADTAKQTPWQEYLEWYTRQIGELTRLQLSPPEERETERSVDDSALKGRMDEKYSRNWYPKLTKDEWDIANRAIKNYTGFDFDEATRFALKSEKGNSVFVIYSKGPDATMLYAVGGRWAKTADAIVTALKGEKTDDLVGAARKLNRSIEAAERTPERSVPGYALSGDGRTAGTAGAVFAGQSGTQTNRRGYSQEGLRDTELIALANALKNGRTSWNRGGKASTEIGTDYLSTVKSGDKETAQRIPAKQTPWQEYLEWYTRQIGEPTRRQLSPPEERETVWQRYLHQQEKEREIEKALKTVEILGTVPEEYAELLEEAPGTDALVALRHWEDRRRRDK